MNIKSIKYTLSLLIAACLIIGELGDKSALASFEILARVKSRLVPQI